MSHPDPRANKINQELAQLPDEVLDDLLRFNTRVTRLTLVPAYRMETVFFRPTRSFSTYLLLASGTGTTNGEGTALIEVSSLLHCVQRGEPMHSGLHPQPTVGTTVPGQPIVSGAPIVVVTGRGKAPVIFTTTANETAAGLNPSPGSFNTAWGSPLPGSGTTSPQVTITSFLHDGSIAPRAAFGWHLTLELLFAVFIEG